MLFCCREIKRLLLKLDTYGGRGPNRHFFFFLSKQQFIQLHKFLSFHFIFCCSKHWSTKNLLGFRVIRMFYWNLLIFYPCLLEAFLSFGFLLKIPILKFLIRKHLKACNFLVSNLISNLAH